MQLQKMRRTNSQISSQLLFATTLLPQNIFFDTRDFLVFGEMEWSTKELPADDVEDCIRSLKSAHPNLDPTDPADREKISREIAKFFADPGKKV